MAKYKLHKSDQILINVHPKKACKGNYCCIHNPSKHALRGWPQYWRGDRRLMERISPWGCGCPDPDDPSKDKVHGCVLNPYTKTTGVCQYWEIDGVEAAWIDRRYAVTKDGRVWSFAKKQRIKHGNKCIEDYTEAKQLKTKNNGRGYMSVMLGSRRQEYVHRLVLTAWQGECPEEHETRHLNGSRADNRLENLEWADPSTNNLDKHKHGTMLKAEKHPNSKLTSSIVKIARMMFSNGYTLDKIVSALDLTANRATLHEAIIGNTWKDAGGPISKIKGRWNKRK